MPLITTSVSNLIQGVSQQPDSVRFVGQCEEQENALSSIVDGLQKRPGCQHVATLIDDAILDENAKVHFIERDNNERYVVIIHTKTDSTKSIAAYNLTTGNQATITERYTGVVKSYLTSDTEGYQVAILTQPCPVTVLSSESSRLGELRIIEGLNKSETTYPIHDVGANTTRDRVRFTAADISLYGDETGSYQNVIEYTVNNTANAELILESRNYLTYGVDDSTPTVPIDDLKLFTTGDVTYVLNTKKTVTKDTTFSSPLSKEALVFVKQGDYDRKYGVSVTAPDDTVYTNWTYSGNAQVRVSGNTYNNAKQAESDFILRNLFEGEINQLSIPEGEPRGVKDVGRDPDVGHERYDKPLNYDTVPYIETLFNNGLYDDLNESNNPKYLDNPSLASNPSFSVELKGGQIGIIRGPEGFTVHADDSASGDLLGIAYKSTPQITDLPNIATHRFKIAVQGDVDAGEDDRYVEFLINGYSPETAVGALGEGGWFETSGGSLKDRINTNTMPLLLKSTGVDTFELNHMPLDKMEAGDEYTNPDPSFVGSSIERVFQFKGRLGFLSGSAVCMSEVKFGSYDGDVDVQRYNFYRTSVTSLLDGDPIDVNVSSDKVTKLRAAVAFQDNLVLFSDFCQFVLRGGDLLTAKTVSFNQITEYDYSPTVEPVAIGSYIYFPFSRSGFVGIREFTVNSTTDVFDANEITDHVPQYIPQSSTGGLVAVSGSSADSLMAVTDGNDIYVYKYYFKGNEKVLSSWSKFTLSGGNIRGLSFIDSDLYIVQSVNSPYVNQTYLLKMPLGSKFRDSEGYNTLLDRRVEVTLDATAPVPSFTIPYLIGEDEELEIYTKNGLLIQNAVTTRVNSTTVVTFKNNFVGGGLTGAEEKLYVGISYNMKYTFSRMLFKAQSGQNMTLTDGKMRVRGGVIFFEDTAHFKVKVTPFLRDTSTSEFNATVVQQTKEGSIPLESGSFRFPVLTDPQQTEITIENSTAMPCNLQSVEFESFVHQRSRRYA